MMFESGFKFKLAKLLLGVLMVVVAVAVRTGAQGNASFKVGVLPFVDNSGSGGSDLASALSRAVQAEIAHSTQLQGRAIPLDNGVNATSLDSTKAVQIGQAQNVDVVMMGTVLTASSQRSSKSMSGPTIGGFHVGGNAQETKAVVTLQADLYDVTTGKQIESIRVTGNASQKGVGGDVSTSLGDLSSGGNSFDNSPIGQAFHRAVADLVKRIANDQSQMTHYTGSANPGVTSGAIPTPVASVPAAPPGNPSAIANAPAGVAPGAPGQPDLKATRIDFVPGEKTAFYDDFSDAAEDEPPPHWMVRGDPIELRVGGGIRQLTNISHSTLTSAPIAFPASFTFEAEIKFPTQSDTVPGIQWDFQTKNGQGAASLHVFIHPGDRTLSFTASDSKDQIGGKDYSNFDFTQPVQLALWSQQGRFRVYINGERALDVNQTTVPTPNHIFVTFNPGGAPAEIGLRRVRVAESTPDFSTVLANTGKFVTHGITFDTDSDRLKPDSAPVLKQVVAGLEKNPNLKLEIDGYTDSVGDAAHNLDLSKRRAEAVKTVLVAQFGIDAGRLTSNGFGVAKPIGSNDTSDGRAQNRRVEFIKK
jgi:outer membrane protein OmpA-like peptidoglycan-associated protein